MGEAAVICSMQRSDCSILLVQRYSPFQMSIFRVYEMSLQTASVGIPAQTYPPGGRGRGGVFVLEGALPSMGIWWLLQAGCAVRRAAPVRASSACAGDGGQQVLGGGGCGADAGVGEGPAGHRVQLPHAQKAPPACQHCPPGCGQTYPKALVQASISLFSIEHIHALPLLTPCCLLLIVGESRELRRSARVESTISALHGILAVSSIDKIKVADLLAAMLL